MDRTESLDSGPDADGGPLSPASSSATLIPTPGSSEASGADPSLESTAMPAAVPEGPLRVTTLSTTSWRPQYPRIGQFAMTPSEEVVAAGPDGLIYFMRVRDHPSKPWSEPRPFPRTTARLDASTVTGLTVHREPGKRGTLHVYCVADGVLHAFSHSEGSGSSLVIDPSPPFTRSRVSGTPAVARLEAGYDNESWCVVVPCESGGILYTSTRPPKRQFYGGPTQVWESVHPVAAHVGIISAVSVVVTHYKKRTINDRLTDETTKDIAVACISNARLYTIEWPLEQPSMSGKQGWESPRCIRVQHPGEVVGNPVLLNSSMDLLVPSAEGGIFHFVRTPRSLLDDWHMIGRVKFPSGVPMASSLTCALLAREFHAYLQCGGRLYLIKTLEGPFPWVGCQMYPIAGPGPFLC